MVRLRIVQYLLFNHRRDVATLLKLNIPLFNGYRIITTNTKTFKYFTYDLRICGQLLQNNYFEELDDSAVSTLCVRSRKLSDARKSRSSDGWPKMHFFEMLRVLQGMISRWSSLHLQSLPFTYSHWARGAGYDLFFVGIIQWGYWWVDDDFQRTWIILDFFIMAVDCHYFQCDMVFAFVWVSLHAPTHIHVNANIPLRYVVIYTLAIPQCPHGGLLRDLFLPVFLFIRTGCALAVARLSRW
jgi:hypothetical protein